MSATINIFQFDQITKDLKSYKIVTIKTIFFNIIILDYIIFFFPGGNGVVVSTYNHKVAGSSLHFGAL